jgi:hypothetical protein
MARPASNTLHTLLIENDTLQPLVARLRRVNSLQQIYFEALADALPELEGLAQASRVSAIVGTTIVISAANGPVAAKLKQVVPRLLLKFQMQEQKLTSIQVEVQPDWAVTTSATAPAKSPARNPIPDEQLADLADSLSDSPLKSALEQIKKRRGRKKTQAG